MKRACIGIALIVSMLISAAYARDVSQRNGSVIALPQPDVKGGLPLMQTLASRATRRTFKDQSLPRQVLADLLWAANGINRETSGKRTAPSSHQLREIEIYVVISQGAFLYIPDKHALRRIHDLDMRLATAEQAYIRTAPVNMIYVADFSKFASRLNDPKQEALKKQISSTHCGFIGQNVYLFCASEGLNCVFHGWMDAAKIHAMLQLPPHKRVLFGQAVGR